jgi:molecular chaperone HscB
MVCWSCEKNAGTGALCTSCGAVQPTDAQADHFAVFGLPRAYPLDTRDLERRYKELTKQLHPDRWAKSDPRARRASLARTVQLNDAWRVLRDPVKRAEYLLSLAGVDVGGEEGTRKLNAAGERVRVPVPQDLLMETMELREALMDARLKDDDAEVERLADEVRARRDRALANVARDLGPSADHDAAVRELVALRYYQRFLEEVSAHEDARAEAPHA